MPDPIAIWGVITGTGALGFTAKREIEARRMLRTMGMLVGMGWG